jgi:subtilisin family serine protease
VDTTGDGEANFHFRNPDFNVREFNTNAVLRWEYRPGSTLFVVWQQQRSGFMPDGRFSLGVSVGSTIDVVRTAPLVIAQLTDQEVETLRKDQNVKEIEEDGLCYALGEFEDVGHLLFEDQPAPQAETVPAGVSRIKAPLAWDATRGKGIKVAVLDTGIDFDHPDLAPNYRGGVSFVPDEASAKDFNRHGTHCAVTIAAAINGRGVVGVYNPAGKPIASLFESPDVQPIQTIPSYCVMRTEVSCRHRRTGL